MHGSLNDALALIESVRNELKIGTLHYQGDRLLTTELEIIEAMLRGPITLIRPPVCDNATITLKVGR